ncbi:MAG: hypothetical protein A3J93_02485 [Candidatus Magasanikbacteria bacterium RIFOXYC2_FULL_42_28]|uniref:Uncharacterized protein n=1 Tax=Candidatus Magasanikbacteria bacterium RIFOXYC2_FULL_42_28 TaxID=1798704 RepID=A0A1F6NVQ5_9BACT|nr:MAG: hypothetical protein A3J93_02485 [Candidatus Magasanikbacteria bacterium RIFOXYC2_FULL_42_28]
MFMKKITVFIFVILLGISIGPDFASGEITPGGTLHNNFTKTEPALDKLFSDKCQHKSACVCSIDFSTGGGFGGNILDKFGVAPIYYGVFTENSKLYSGDLKQVNGLYGLLSDWEFNLTMLNDVCTKITTPINRVGRLGGASTDINDFASPRILCQFFKGEQPNCCCVRSVDDGSVSCVETPKKLQDNSCVIGCEKDAIVNDLGPDGTCASYEHDPITSTLKTGDLKSLQASAKLKLNPFKWLTESTATGRVNEFIGKVIYFLMGIIGSLLLLFYVWAGFLWMTAQGNAEQITKAKHILLWATLSIIVQMAAYWLVRSLFSLF